MVTRILFVDDESLVLQGLRRALWDMRGEWLMEFAETPQRALEVLRAKSFDVIVSDMRMPNIDGAELLNELMRTQPRVLRIALSGYSDQALILRAIGPTHYFLAKPCDAEQLKAVVRRACAMRDVLRAPKLERLIGSMGSLASEPNMYGRLEAAVRSGAPSLQEIPNIVTEDPAMSAKLLQLVGSAFFGAPQASPAPGDAVDGLGLDTMRALVLTARAFSAVTPRPDTFDDFWEHSLRVSKAAAALAKSEANESSDIDISVIEESRTAGLVHDIGQLLLMTKLPDEYNRVVARAHHDEAPLWEVEYDEFGASHAAVGAYLLATWGFADAIVGATASHHSVEGEGVARFTAVRAVRAADALDRSFAWPHSARASS